MKDLKINILVSQHFDSYLPNLKTIKPIACGSYKHSDKLSDSTGINISHLNEKYCELTAQFWAWKNMESDYYGFFHYRRFLSFNENSKIGKFEYQCFDQNFIDKTFLNDEIISNIVSKYDIIIPSPIKFSESIYSQYKYSKYHNIKDLDKILNILQNKHPEYKKSIKYIKKTKNFYSGNIYIMKKEIFFDYCSWLFPLLEEFNKNYNYEKSNIYSMRVIGFLAKRLFNIYFHFLKTKNKNLKIKTLSLCLIKDVSNPYPEKQKNSIPVVLACDNKYAKYAGMIVEEIMVNNKSNSYYEIFIMSNNISKFWCEKLEIMSKKYNNLSLTIVDAANRWLKNRLLNETNRVNKTTYLRICILDYLKNYDKVIYLDCDITVNDDLSEFYKINIDNYALGASYDIVHISHFYDTKSKHSNSCDKYGIKNKWNYFNAGILLMNLKKMNEISSCNELLSLCEKNKYEWQDQDALNVTYQGYVKFISNKWNCFSHNRIVWVNVPEINAPKKFYEKYLEACKNPSIIHYSNNTIPSFCGNSSLSEYFWKYAEKSDFYYDVLRDMVTTNEPKKYKKSIKAKFINLIKKNRLVYNICLFIYRHIFIK